MGGDQRHPWHAVRAADACGELSLPTHRRTQRRDLSQHKLARRKEPVPTASKHTPGLPRVNILGVRIAALNLSRALDEAEQWIARRERRRAHFCTVHTIMEARRDPGLRRILNTADLAAPDGMPLVWLGRHAGYQEAGRVYGPDFMLGLCQRGASTGVRHFFYGGAPGVAERLRDELCRCIPDLIVVGTYAPPLRPVGFVEDQAVLDAIDAAQPDVVWVGLGTPKQDFWLGQHRARLQAPLLAAVGAAFDFHAGLVPQAPRWMQARGLEWLFRLAQEPRRLWYRYLVYNPLFVGHVALQLSGMRRYDPAD